MASAAEVLQPGMKGNASQNPVGLVGVVVSGVESARAVTRMVSIRVMGAVPVWVGGWDGGVATVGDVRGDTGGVCLGSVQCPKEQGVDRCGVGVVGA